VDWGSAYDVVLLTNILHHFDGPTCETLASKAFASLAPCGRAVTLDFIPEPDRITPPSVAVFALTMLATTAHGDAYTFAEYQQVFAKAGFLRSSSTPCRRRCSRQWCRTRAKATPGRRAIHGACR
jgi:hypothetical protein